MTCGLPTFATCHGGPAEIIVDSVSGFHIDPYQGDKAAEILVSFFGKCKEDPTYWDQISQGGLRRIYEKYLSQLSKRNLFIPIKISPLQIKICAFSFMFLGTLGSCTLRG